MSELSFIIGCLLIGVIAIYLMKANILLSNNKRRKYIKPINKVNPKVKNEYI